MSRRAEVNAVIRAHMATGCDHCENHGDSIEKMCRVGKELSMELLEAMKAEPRPEGFWLIIPEHSHTREQKAAKALRKAMSYVAEDDANRRMLESKAHDRGTWQKAADEVGWNEVVES